MDENLQGGAKKMIKRGVAVNINGLFAYADISTEEECERFEGNPGDGITVFIPYPNVEQGVIDSVIEEEEN